MAHPAQGPASPLPVSRRPLSFPLSTIFDPTAFPPPKYIVEPLLREGAIGYIGAEPKSLKSFLALSLGLDIASGVNAFGHFPIERPWRVLFIEEEDDHGIIRQRLDLFRKVRGERWPLDENFRLALRTGLRVHPARPEPDDSNPQFSQIEAEISDFRPAIIFVDAFNRVHDGEENSQKDMTRVMERFENIRRRYGCAIILVHHFNKVVQGKSAKANQRLRGSSALAAWAENSLYVVRRDRDNTLTIEPESKFGPSEPFSIRLEQVPMGPESYGLRFTYLGAPQGRKSSDENREKLLTILTDLHGTTPDACTIDFLHSRLDLSQSTVRNLLAELEDQGRVTHEEARGGGRGQARHVYYPVSVPKTPETHG